jgi:TrmH family RNA methyltransferase
VLSARNPRLQRLRRLAHRARDRADEGAFVVEGPGLVAEALDAGLAVEAVFAGPGAPPDLLARLDAAGIPVHVVADGTLEKVVTTVTPQPMAAVVARHDLDLGDLLADAADDGLLVLAGVSDPGNAGTLVRAAEGAGWGGVVLCGGAVDPFNPKCVRSAAGSLFRVPFAVAGDVAAVLERLALTGVTSIATSSHDGDPWDEADLDGRVAVVLGNEAHGLDGDLAQACDRAVRIPLAGRAESLNVAVAGSVVAFERNRRRRAGGETPTRRPAGDPADAIQAVRHELRSPLTSLQGFTKVLADRWDRVDDATKKDLFGQIQHDAHRVSRLVSELLDATRLDSGRLLLQRKQVDLPVLVERVVERLRAEVDELSVAIAWSEGFPTVNADPDRLEQVFTNLIENAVKYASPIGIRVEGRAGPDRVTVSVSDQGDGIPAVDLPNVFEKFYRRDRSRPSGIGLGLWISRGVVEAHGGQLTVTSQQGQGSTFSLTLPIVAPEDGNGLDGSQRWRPA